MGRKRYTMKNIKRMCSDKPDSQNCGDDRYNRCMNKGYKEIKKKKNNTKISGIVFLVLTGICLVAAIVFTVKGMRNPNLDEIAGVFYIFFVVFLIIGLPLYFVGKKQFKEAEEAHERHKSCNQKNTSSNTSSN